MFLISEHYYTLTTDTTVIFIVLYYSSYFFIVPHLLYYSYKYITIRIEINLLPTDFHKFTDIYLPAKPLYWKHFLWLHNIVLVLLRVLNYKLASIF